MMKKIVIKGAKEHNLKNVTVEIPKDKFVVITGLSGSGKSSLAFDTIYAEGQRRYVESLSAYANQAFVKPTIANWGDQKLSNYALGFICPMNAKGLKHICRSGFAGRSNPEDYPLSNRADEVDTLLVFDNVMIPWEDVLFYQLFEI